MGDDESADEGEGLTGPVVPEVKVTDVANARFLKKIWKKQIRPGLRKHTLNDFYLAQDPVQFAAYEWGLVPFINRLVEDLRSATYAPDPADILRGAKARGLSRPLAFLSPRDALLYCAIVDKAGSDLRRELRPWTGALRSEKGERKDVPGGEYSDFFQSWLSRQGIVADICGRFEYVVEGDISNFFGSLDLRVLQEFLQGTTRLHRDLVRLCIHLIRRSLRHPEYAESPTLGLPQESFDASRAIGDALLCEVDREFDVEGEDGVYSRFMDDFVTGADEIFEAEVLISRLQQRLERLGLYPNPAKTKIVPVIEFLHESMADENEFLDEIDDLVDACEEGDLRTIVGFPADEMERVLQRAADFRSISSQDRPGRYDRLLRRYFSLFRRLGIEDWLPYAIGDLAAYPSAGRHVLEYLRSFPLTPEIVSSGFEIIRRSRQCYHDVPLLVLEALTSAPNQIDSDLDAIVVERSVELAAEIALESAIPRSLEDWLVAGLVPLLAKYGERGVVAEFLDRFVVGKPVQSVSRLQAFPLQMSMGYDDSNLFRTNLAGLTWSSVLAIDFVRAIQDGDESAIATSLGLLEPEIRLMPNRFQIHARPLLLVELIGRVDSKRLGRLAGGAVPKLDSNPSRLKDERVIRDMSRFVGLSSG